MKRCSGSKTLSVEMLLWGITALVLRKVLYAVALDGKGLLVRGQPLGIALTVLTVGVLVRILLAVRKADNLSVCTGFPGALGSAAAGAGILVTVLTTGMGTGNSLETAWYSLGLAASACLLLAGVAQILKKQPFFLLHVVVCLFFVVHIVTRYQLWSANPQLQDYIFALLGAMALTFFGFYTAAEEAGCGNPRLQPGMGLAAIYFCMAELARTSWPGLYLGGIIWALTNLSRPRNHSGK